MNKDRSIALERQAHQVAQLFSKKDRPKNVANEEYIVQEVRVLSEGTAAVVFDKQPTGKRAVAWFYWLNRAKNPGWHYFFVTYDHLVGLNRVAGMLHEVEQHNHRVNNGKQ